MSLLKEAWESLRTIALLVDKLDAHDQELKALASEVRDVRERLIALEVIIDYARRSAPRLQHRESG